MPYLGKTPIVGNFQKCDALSASGTADYTLQVSSTNVVPESVNHMIVSLNGVIQSPTTAYTVSGAVLSFASALTSNDTIDFVMLLGDVLDVGVVSDATISTAKIVDAAVTSAKLSAGKVLQIVQGSTSTETRNSTNTLADTTLTAAITPISSSNKVLVLLNQAGCDKSSANASNQMILKLLRGASVIATFANNAGYTNSTLTLSFGSVGCIYLDSPSTTSSTTYKTQLSNGNNTAAVGVQGTGGETSTITLMEIVG